MALNTLDIINIMEPFQKNNVFAGVFASDSLPNRVRLPSAFIINTSPRSSIQGHWVGLYIDEYGSAEYFDSFGFPPEQKTILQFLRLHTKKIIFNKKQIQNLSSVKCGKFAIVFILLKIYKKSFTELLKKFSTNLMINDLVIERIFSHIRETKNF